MDVARAAQALRHFYEKFFKLIRGGGP